jgi:hypothetical protein
MWYVEGGGGILSVLMWYVVGERGGMLSVLMQYMGGMGASRDVLGLFCGGRYRGEEGPRLSSKPTQLINFRMRKRERKESQDTSARGGAEEACS